MINEVNFNIDFWAACGAALTYLTLRKPASELGNILYDCLHECHEHFYNVCKKFRAKCKQKNITKFQKVEPKFGIAWYQAAALENNNTLQELWANLLVNAVDKNFSEDLKVSYIEILKTLTPIEVAILQAFYEFLKENNKWDSDKINDVELLLDKKGISNKLNIKNIDLTASLLNLERCQLITTFHSSGNIFINGSPSVKKGEPRLTALGFLFINACIK